MPVSMSRRKAFSFAARLAEKYVVMAKGAVVVSGKSTELSAEQVRQYLTV